MTVLPALGLRPAITDSACLGGRRVAEGLLLGCARASLAQRAAGGIRQLLHAGETDWEDLRALAREHGILPLLGRNLKQAAGELVPVSVLRRLDHDLRVEAARSLVFSGELIQVTKLLTSHGIRVIPFKGPVLAVSLYGALSLREFVDLDIIIARRDAARAVELLKSCGYSLRAKPGPGGSSVHAGSHISLIRPQNGVVIELQWDIGMRWELTRSSSRLPLDFEDLWSRCGTLDLCGCALPNLSAEDLLLVLCVHGARHHWRRLIWICDIAELVRTHLNLDWNRVVHTAALFHCARRLYVALLLASDLLGAEIPRSVHDRVRSEPAVPTVVAELRRRLFMSASVAGESGGNGYRMAECVGDLDKLALSVALHDRLRDRLRVWLRFLRSRLRPNAADREVISLPSRFAPAFRLIRPARLFCVYGPRSALLLIRTLWACAGWRVNKPVGMRQARKRAGAAG